MNGSIKAAAMNANQCRLFNAILEMLSSYLLESNTHAIAELTQRVLKRENTCELRVIGNMLYLQ
jgi:hypothetical protein